MDKIPFPAFFFLSPFLVSLSARTCRSFFYNRSSWACISLLINEQAWGAFSFFLWWRKKRRMATFPRDSRRWFNPTRAGAKHATRAPVLSPPALGGKTSFCPLFLFPPGPYAGAHILTRCTTDTEAAFRRACRSKAPTAPRSGTRNGHPLVFESTRKPRFLFSFQTNPPPAKIFEIAGAPAGYRLSSSADPDMLKHPAEGLTATRTSPALTKAITRPY